jgi:hypothetical protein
MFGIMEIGRSWRKSTLSPEPSRVSARIPSRKEVWRLGEISRETDITIGLTCQFMVCIRIQKVKVVLEEFLNHFSGFSLLSAGVPNSDRGVDQSNSELFCERI